MFDHGHQDNLMRDGGPDASDATRATRTDLTIVVPTRNEAENIGPLLHRLTEVAGTRRIEVLFVDDSEDNTPEEVHERSLRASIPVRLLLGMAQLLRRALNAVLNERISPAGGATPRDDSCRAGGAYLRRARA